MERSWTRAIRGGAGEKPRPSPCGRGFGKGARYAPSFDPTPPPCPLRQGERGGCRPSHGIVIEICEPALALRRRRSAHGSPPTRAPRCCLITDRPRAPPGTACKPSGTAATPTRWPIPAMPTSPRMSISRLSPRPPVRPARRCMARCRRACFLPGSGCSSAPTGSPARQPPAKAPALIEAARGLPSPTRWAGCSRRWRSATPPADTAGLRIVTPAEYLRSPDLPIAHGFFTRLGGVSTGPYATLNCSLSGGDSRDFGVGKPRPRGTRRRRRASRSARPDPGAWRRTVRITAPWAPGDGPRGRRHGDRSSRTGARHRHRRLRARPVRRHRGRRDRRRTCRLARRGGRRAGGHARSHGGDRRRSPRIVAAIGPCIAPALLRGRRPICARRCWQRPPKPPPASSPAGARNAGSSTCPATAPHGWRRPASPGSTATGRYLRGRGALFQPSPPHAIGRRPDRAPDLHHCALIGLDVARLVASLLCCCCSPPAATYPEPFLGSPGRAAMHCAQPPPAAAGDAAPGTALLTDAAAGTLAAAWPSACDRGGPGRSPSPAGRPTGVSASRSRIAAQVVPTYTVRDAQGRSQGSCKRRPMPPRPGPDAIRHAEDGGRRDRARSIAELLVGIDAARKAAIRTACTTARPKSRCPTSTGAPGDGNPR